MAQRIKNILLVFSCLIVSLVSYSQSPYFKTIALFRSSQEFAVNYIFQDSKGFLWVYTSQGLIRYDGIETTHFGNNDSIDASPVTAIYEDKKRTIWIGHKNGKIETYDSEGIKRFNPEEGLGNSEISFFHCDTTGTLWFGTLGEGIYYFKGKNRERLYNLNVDDGLNDNFVYCAVEDKKGNIYLGTDNGIGVINSKTNKVTNVISMKNGLPDNIVKHIEIEDNTIWVGMEESGVCLYNIENQKFILFPEWSYGTLSCICLRSKNECWVSTRRQGIVKLCFQENKIVAVKNYTKQNGLPANDINFIFSDRENNIWGGTSKGAFVSASSAFEFINKASEGYDLGNTFSFLADKYDNYWAATESGLIRIVKNENGRFTYQPFQLTNQHVAKAFISLYSDIEGNIWAGTYGYGVFQINPKTLQSTCFSISNGLSDNNILYITGTNTDVWFATAGGGAIAYNLKSKSFAIYNEKNGLASSYLYSILPDSKNNIWFALDGKGVSMLKNGKIVNNILPSQFDINTVYSIVEGKEGEIWFQTPDKGLVYLRDNKYTLFNTNKGLISDNIRGIMPDKDGNLIISSNEGIQVFIAAVADFESFGEERGLAFLEPSLNGISRDNHDNIWIATKSGIVKYDVNQMLNTGITPKLSITNKLLFFNTIEKGRSRFGHNENNFTFEYAGIWFQAPENITYRYKLENYDFDWSRRTQARSVTYSSLPPGSYTFKVEVSNKPGIWYNSESATFSFNIRPPFYKTWWFIALCTVTLVLSVLRYIRARTAKLIRAKEALELEVKKRTATISHQKEEIESQRDEIEAQRDFVIKQRDQIANQNEHIKSGIQYASRIQRALLPNFDDFKQHLPDIFILNRPMDIVSGDFYWISHRNNRCFIVVADCTGHGVSGAFMSVLGISSLTKIVNNNTDITPGEILNQLRDDVKLALKQKGVTGELQDGMDIAVVIIESDRKTFQYAGANNSMYIINNKQLNILKPDKMPIGIYLEEFPFSSLSGTFEQNDMVYLFSDGYQDQFGGIPERKFKTKAFQELLLNISDLPLNEQHATLDNVMNEWKNGKLQNDDILIVGFRIA